jgi:hypothetical protein
LLQGQHFELNWIGKHSKQILKLKKMNLKKQNWIYGFSFFGKITIG